MNIYIVIFIILTTITNIVYNLDYIYIYFVVLAEITNITYAYKCEIIDVHI